MLWFFIELVNGEVLLLFENPIQYHQGDFWISILHSVYKYSIWLQREQHRDALKS